MLAAPKLELEQQKARKPRQLLLHSLLLSPFTRNNSFGNKLSDVFSILQVILMALFWATGDKLSRVTRQTQGRRDFFKFLA